MQREYPVNGSIDFAMAVRPAYIELVVIRHDTEFFAGQNRSELRKLSRISSARAGKRILMILDTYEDVFKKRLRKTYDKFHVDNRGIREYHNVTVMYIHPRMNYSFRWRP